MLVHKYELPPVPDEGVSRRRSGVVLPSVGAQIRTTCSLPSMHSWNSAGFPSNFREVIVLHDGHRKKLTILNVKKEATLDMIIDMYIYCFRMPDMPNFV